MNDKYKNLKDLLISQTDKDFYETIEELTIKSNQSSLSLIMEYNQLIKNITTSYFNDKGQYPRREEIEKMTYEILDLMKKKYEL